MQHKIILEVKELCTSFRTSESESQAVKGISFKLHEGETLAIVGESGSGKSVTSLSIMHLLPPQGRISGGEVIYHHLDGNTENLADLPANAMRRYRGRHLAMIFQEPMTSLNPVMTCGQQIIEALELHQKLSASAARKRCLELFQEVELPFPEQMLDRYPHQLSGGQKQRVMIAMALSCEPRLLIADEPTTALDVTVQKTILELLKNLQKKYNMGILFITHDLGVVAELADRVMVMYKGKCLEEGPVNKMFTQPSHAYTKSLLSCKPPLDSKPVRLPVVSDFLELGDGGEFRFKSEMETGIKGKEEKVKQRQEKNTSVLIRVENLTVTYPGKKSLFGKLLSYNPILQSLNFEVYQGETLGLVGESGCGKTTLGRSLLRLVNAEKGKIIYKGMDILGMKESRFRALRQNMQIIFQDPYSSLNPRLMVGEAIAEPMRVYKLFRNETEIISKVKELLVKVGLEPGQYYRYPHEFSGGQRQRVCIARALALRPEFIICDESVSALDVSVQAQVLNLLNDLKGEFGFTIIFISHDLGVVKYMSDRMMVMRKGRIEEMGNPEEIYSSPKSEYTRRLIDSIPKFKNHIN